MEWVNKTVCIRFIVIVQMKVSPEADLAANSDFLSHNLFFQ